VSERATALFQRGTEIAAERGLLLVDTKYEFGLDPAGRVVLADEIHTQDSSRYWMKGSYEERMNRGEAPEMLDKEFFRRWLIERGYMGEGPKPTIPDDFRVETALKYIEAYELITGRSFSPLLGDQTLPITEAVKRAPSLTR
jgi:phosphoribosylaminoimidazole-succinocarboxamide synthase